MKDLTLEDFEKLKHWAQKNNNTGTCPMCGSRCIIEPVRKEKENATGNNDNPGFAREITA